MWAGQAAMNAHQLSFPSTHTHIYRPSPGISVQSAVGIGEWVCGCHSSNGGLHLADRQPHPWPPPARSRHHLHQLTAAKECASSYLCRHTGHYAEMYSGVPSAIENVLLIFIQNCYRFLFLNSPNIEIITNNDAR